MDEYEVKALIEPPVLSLVAVLEEIAGHLEKIVECIDEDEDGNRFLSVGGGMNIVRVE